MGFYRLQDIDGRGPYRPGFSRVWVDNTDVCPPPPIQMEFPEFYDTCLEHAKAGNHVGCAVPSELGLKHWFSTNELRRLACLGFYAVQLPKSAKVLFQSENQIVFSWHRPLSKLPRVAMRKATQ